jgi:hypothetical protein
MVPLFSDQSVYFYISLCSSNYKSSGSARLLTYNITSWENHDLTVLPVITYIYLCVQIYASFSILCFKPPCWNKVQTELKCNTGIRENIPLTFYHAQTVDS